MPTRSLVAVLLGLISFAGMRGGEDPQFEGSLAVPKYEGGYVLDWDAPRYTKFTLYGPDTKPLYSLPLRANESTYDGWAVDVDGAAARTYFERGQRGKVDVLDVAGKVVRTIDTGLYIPTHVAFAPDHTVWTLGYLSGYEAREEDFGVLRHYSRAGEKLAEVLPWSAIAGESKADGGVHSILGGRLLFVASDRIGFIAGLNRGRQEWIEVSFAGELLGQYDLGSYGGTEAGFSPLAFTASGEVYARVERYRRFKGYAVLDKQSGTWRKVTGYPKGALVGTDGDKLIFSELVGGWTVLHEVESRVLALKNVDAPAIGSN